MTKEMHVDELEGKIYRILEESTKSNDGGPFWFGSDNKNIFEYDLGEGKKGYCAFLVQRCHKPTVCCFMASAELPLAGKSIALPCGCKIVCELLPELPPDNVQEVVEEMIQKACKRMAALSDEKTPRKFSKGDVVVENNAKMRMTVEISDDPRSVGCVWFDEEDHLHRAKFDENNLNTIPPAITPEVAHD